MPGRAAADDAQNRLLLADVGIIIAVVTIGKFSLLLDYEKYL